MACNLSIVLKALSMVMSPMALSACVCTSLVACAMIPVSAFVMFMGVSCVFIRMGVGG